MLEKPPNRLLSEPLIQIKPESKVPVGTYESVLPTWKVVEGLADGYNVGICLDCSDLVVVDADTTEVAEWVVEELPETFTVETGGDGFGVHYYFECPEWGPTKHLQDGDSSVRSSGAMAVLPPSTHPETGREYRVTRDIPPAVIEVEELDRLVDDLTVDRGGSDDQVDRTPRRQSGGGGLDELDRLINHDGKRREFREILNDPNAEHRRRVYLAGWLHSVAGLSASEIVRLIDRFNQWSNYDRQITETQVKSVIESSRGGR